MPNNQNWTNPGSRTAPNVALSAIYRAVTGGGGEPSGPLSISGVTDNGDGTLTITGTGFGTKTQAAPVLVDYIHTAYENGVANSYYGTIANGAALPKTSQNSAALYTHVTPYDTVKISESVLRHAGATRSYHLQGGGAYVNDQWIGKPKAGGWPDNLPAGKQPHYLSFWLRTNHNHLSTWDIIPTEAVSGAFITGEAITVAGYSGFYLGTYGNQLDYPHGRFVLEITGTSQTITGTGLQGATIIGQTSEATATFPLYSLSSGTTPGMGYTLPGTKLIRIWDAPSRSYSDLTLQISVAVHDYYLGVGPSASRANGFTNSTPYPLVKNQWQHVEIEIDTQAGRMRHWVDTVLRGDNSWNPDLVGDPDFSPTLNDLGWDGGVTGISDSYISDVYFDHALQRIYIGNASTWAACTHVELQRPAAWADTQLFAYQHWGALAGGNGWLYVKNVNGEINANGWPL